MLKFVDAMGSILAPILCTFEAVIRLFNHHIYRSILSPGSWGQAILHSRQEDGQGLRVWEDEVFHHVQVLGCSPCVKTVHILALVDYIPTYLHTYIHTYIPTYQPTYLPTYLPTHLPTNLLTYLPMHLQPFYIYSMSQSREHSLLGEGTLYGWSPV